MVSLGSNNTAWAPGGRSEPCVLLRPHSQTKDPGTCVVSEEGEEERGPGHGRDALGALPSVSLSSDSAPLISSIPLCTPGEGVLS